MHSFPQFTRSTLGGVCFNGGNYLLGKLYGERVIFWRVIFLGGNCLGGNCPGGNFPRGQLSSGAIVRGAIIRGAIIQGEFIRGAIFLGGSCPKTLSKADGKKMKQIN